MKPYVQLTAEDGNVFFIVGRVSKVLKAEGLEDQAKEFTEKAFGCASYQEILQLVTDYCEVG